MILSPLFLVIAKAETAMSIAFATLLYAYGASIAGDIYQRRWLFLPIICGLIAILYLVSKSNNWIACDGLELHGYMPPNTFLT